MSKSLEIKVIDKSVSLLPLRYFSFYKLFSLIISQCLPKSKFPACFLLYSVYEETPEGILDETDVESHFYHNILDISQSHHRIVRISKGSKKIFCNQSLSFLRCKVTAAIYSQGGSQHFQKKIESLFDSLGDFLQAFDQANKVLQILLPKPKFEVGFTQTKDELFSQCYKDIVEHLNRQFRLSFRFEKTRVVSFPSKSLNNTVILSFLQKLST